MSRFRSSVPTLAALTGAPLFAAMRDSGEAKPMAIGIWKAAVAATGQGGRKEVRRMLHRLTTSKRYIASCAAEGARRHNLDGSDAGPVSDTHRERAIALLAAYRATKTAPVERQQEGVSA